MSMGKISSPQSAAGLVQDVLRSLQRDAGGLLEQTIAPEDAVPSAVAKTVPPSMMSRNFVSASTDDSGYGASLKLGKAAQQRMDIQQNNRVTSLLGTLGGIRGPSLYGGGGSKGAIQAATVQKAMQRIKNAESGDASRRNLDEIKGYIEEKAQEATTHIDPNANPVDFPDTGSGDSTMPSGVSVAPDQPESVPDGMEDNPSASNSSQGSPAVSSVNVIVW